MFNLIPSRLSILIVTHRPILIRELTPYYPTSSNQRWFPERVDFAKLIPFAYLAQYKRVSSHGFPVSRSLPRSLSRYYNGPDITAFQVGQPFTASLIPRSDQNAQITLMQSLFCHYNTSLPKFQYWPRPDHTVLTPLPRHLSSSGYYWSQQ